MNEFLILSYEFLCVSAGALAAHGILRARQRRIGFQPSRGQVIWLLLLLVYLTDVFQVTGAGTIYHLRQYGFEPGVTQMNLLPFSDPEYDLTANILNVVLFLPLGFLLPLLWPEWNRPIPVLLFGAAFSLLIEASQLLNIRNTDVDDILLNTLGAVIGLLLYRAFAARSKRKQPPAGAGRWEAVLYVAAMFFGYFLLFNEFGAAKILYGF